MKRYSLCRRDKIGDNDMLAAYTTVCGGDLLIMLSDIEGIYTK